MIVIVYAIRTLSKFSHVKDNQLRYGQFSKFHDCFCGLDPGNLTFETVRTNRQHICF